MTVKHSVLFYSTQLCYICLIVEYTVIWDMHQKQQPYKMKKHGNFMQFSYEFHRVRKQPLDGAFLLRIWFDANCRSGGWPGPRRTTTATIWWLGDHHVIGFLGLLINFKHEHLRDNMMYLGKYGEIVDKFDQWWRNWGSCYPLNTWRTWWNEMSDRFAGSDVEQP